ncbi:diaminopimelate epimerase [soil metagenome]
MSTASVNSSPLEFYKAHGLGNDYLAVEEADWPELSPAAVRLVCDRHRGVGSDGILLRVTAGDGFRVRIFNPDGSEAEKSGNGLRIFAAYLLSRGEIDMDEVATVDTAGGAAEVRVLARDASGVLDVTVRMGVAAFRNGDVGLHGEDREVVDEPLPLAGGERVPIHAVSVGNPHCVVFRDRLDSAELRTLGPALSSHPAFRAGANVQLARIAGPAAVDALVWERGAGETSASGSSACAVAAAAVRAGLLRGPDVEVRMPGGSLAVRVGPGWELLLRGPVAEVCSGVLSAGLESRVRAAAPVPSTPLHA